MLALMPDSSTFLPWGLHSLAQAAVVAKFGTAPMLFLKPHARSSNAVQIAVLGALYRGLCALYAANLPKS